MADELPPLVAVLLGDASDLFSVLDDAETRLTAFANQEFDAQLGVQISQLIEGIAAAESLLDQFGNIEKTAQANVAITEAVAAIGAVEADLATFMATPADKTITITTDESSLAAAKLYIDSIAKVPTLIPLEVDQGDLVGSLAASQALLQTFAAQQYNVAINPHINETMTIEQMADLDATLSAMGMVPIEPVIDQGRIARILAELKTVTNQHVLDIETAAAEAKVTALEAQILTIDDLEPMVNINTSIAEAKIAALDASIASLKAEAILSGGGGLGAGGGQTPGGQGGGGNFLGTLLGGMFAGGGRNAIGFGQPLLPRIPVAGFGTLGALGGMGAESILGLGAGVLGSAAHAAIGGTALGITSLGVSAVGMGTDLAGIGQASGDIKTTYTNLQALNAAVQQFGAKSTQAAAAQATLNQGLLGFSAAARPAVLAAAQTAVGFQKMFDQVTGPAEATGAQIINQLMHVGEKFLPTIGRFAAENTKIIQSSLQPLLTWLQGPGLTAFNQIEQVFTDHLPKAMNAFDQAVELVIRTIAHFAPQTGGLISFLDNLFSKLNGSGFNKFIGQVQSAIDSFHVWEKFIHSIGTAIYELFHNDAGTGESFIKTLTTLIDKFNTWAKTVAGGDKLHEYMEAHKQEVLQLVNLLGNLVSIMGQVHLAAGPALMTIVADLVKFVNLLLKIPGVDKIVAYGIAFEILGRHISLLRPLLDAFNNGIKNLALGGLHILGDALTGLGGPFAKIGGWLSGLGSGGGMAESMTAAASAMESAAASMEASAATISEAMAGVGVAADTMAADVEGSSVAMSTAMDAAAGDIDVAGGLIEGGFDAMAVGAAVLDAIPIVALVAGIAAALAGLGFVVYKLVTDWSGSWARIKTTFDSVVGFLRSGFGTLVVMITGPIAPLLLLALHWQQVWSTMQSVASDVWGAIRGVLSYLTSAWNAVVSFFSGIPGRILGALGSASSLLLGWGSSVMSGLWSGVQSGWHATLSFFTGIASTVVNFFHGAATWLVDVGKAIVDGLKQGMVGAWDSVKNWVVGKARDVVGWFKDALHIASPSGLMVPVGQAVTDGLVVGMQNGSKLAVTTAKNIAQDISNAFGSLKAPAAAAAAIQSMATFFSNLAKMFTSIQTAVNAAPDVTTKGITVIANALNSLATTGVNSLNTAIENVDSAFASCGNAAIKVMQTVTKTFTAITNLFQVIGKAAGAAKNTTSIASIVYGLLNVADYGVYVLAALGKVEGIFASCYAATPPALKAITDTFNAIANIFNAIGKAANAAKNTTSIASVIYGLLNIADYGVYIQAGLVKVEGIFASCYAMSMPALKAISNTFNAIANVFNAVTKPANAAAKTTTIASIVYGLGNLIAGGTFITGELSTLEGIFAGCYAATIPALKSIQNLMGGLTKIFNAVGTASNASDNASSGAVANIVKALTDLGTTQTGSIFTALTAVLTAFNNLQALALPTINSVTTLFDQITKLFGAVGKTSTAAGNTAGLSSATTALQNLAQEATPFEKAMQAVQTALDHVASNLQGMPAKLTPNAAAIVKVFSGLGPQMLTPINDLDSKMETAGENLMTGLKNGISAGKQAVITAATAVGNAAVNAVKTVTKTLSPSQVFHDIGMNLMLGLANGISQNAHLVTGALKNINLTIPNNQLQGRIAIGNAGVSAIGGISPIRGVASSTTPQILQVTTPLTVDGRTIATAVTKYQLQGARATGNIGGRYSGGNQTGTATGTNVNSGISR